MTESGTYTHNTTLNNFSMSFDGIDDYIDLQSPTILEDLSQSSYTIMLSFKANSLTSFGCDGSESNYVSLVRDESNFNLLIKDNKLCAEILTTDGLYLQETSDINLDENEWYNIACVWNGQNFFFHINDESEQANSGNTSYNPSFTSNLKIGGGGPYCQYFDGKIDNIHMWSLALNDEVIQNYMECLPNGNEENLVGLWNFEDNNEISVEDLSTNNNSGFINGATLSEDAPISNCLLTNKFGCDSTIILNLTINNSSSSSEDVTSCDSFDWNGETYTNSGVYTFESSNEFGCTDIATLNLTINNSSSSSEDVTSCDSYDWNGITYTESGIYTYSTNNSVGCDSTATLNLTINYSSTSLVQ